MLDTNHPDLVKAFFDHNSRRSEAFTSTDQALQRRLYRAKYPTQIAALKCMDGRLNFAHITGIPLGIVQPYRDLGGKFDVGGHFGELLSEWVKHGMSKGQNSIVFVTYHFSAGDRHRGCAGHNYDCESAKANAFSIRKDVEKVFGSGHAVVYPIVAGIETDFDALILHGADDQTWDLAKAEFDDEVHVSAKLAELFPDMDETMRHCLVPICVGNIKHIRDIKSQNRPPIELDHMETYLGLGRGFGWFHTPNKMLIVGPYNYNLAGPIVTAGSILLKNIKDGRVSADRGIALIASAVYRDPSGPDPARAALKARSLTKVALEALRAGIPELMPYLTVGAGILDENTNLLKQIDISDLWRPGQN